MGLVINNNLAGVNAQKQLNKTDAAREKSLEKLSSGLRIASAADDSAGLAISDRMNAQLQALNQAVRNAEDGVSLTQTADAALDATSSILQRMRELSVQASSDTLSASDRGAVQREAADLTTELDRIGSTTSFNGKNLLDGSFSASIQVGGGGDQTVDVEIGDARPSALGVSSLDLSSADGAMSAIASIDKALGQVDKMRTDVGAAQGRFQATISNIQSVAENTSASLSRIRDVDVAMEVARSTRLDILQRSDVAVMAQASRMPQAALSLLG